MKNTGLGKGLDSLIPINDADNNSRENVLETDGWWLNISHLQ
jgi:hypothetical protein